MTDVEKIRESIVNLSRQLYPTGRAFIMPVKSVLAKLHEGLAISESRAIEELIGIYDRLLPDNDNFSVEDATRWETALGMYRSEGLALEDRKKAILRKIKFPGNKLYRQTGEYLQEQLYEAGFDVTVDKNASTDISKYGNLNYADGNYSDILTSDYTVIANEIYESREDLSYSDQNINDRFIFEIKGSAIPASRKNEFRELILRIKPAHTVGYLYVNYV